MSHVALYRKYRPDIFEKLAGQRHISQTLINQIKDNKLSHAYLFTGPRGTGKTTTAKIISRVVNCLNPNGHNPCNQCDSCKQILSDSFLDVIEMDAASHNGVDDIREMIEGVKFPPSLGKMKVTIIDEVHMLSKGAFNALLKTLEDPPRYMIFILATTEPNKIPPTIISRCQRYDFKRIDSESMIDYLKKISDEENINISEDALNAIAVQSGGAMRDALSILEQVASSSKDRIETEEISIVLGSADEDIYLILKHLLMGNISEVFKISRELYHRGKDVKVISQELIEILRKALLFSAGTPNKFSGIDPDEAKVFEEIGTREKQSFFLMALEEFISLNKARHFENPWAGFEYVLGRICTKPEKENPLHLNAKIEELEARLSALESSIGAKTGVQNLESIQENSEQKPVSVTMEEEIIQDDNFFENDFFEDEPIIEDEPSTIEEIEPSNEGPKIREGWSEILSAVQDENKAAFSILKKTSIISIEDGLITLGIPKKLSILSQSFNPGGTGDILKNKINEIYGIQTDIKTEIID